MGSNPIPSSELAMTIDERRAVLANRIRESRVWCGFTQRQVADWLGFASDDTVRAIEQGKRDVSALELHNLALLFRCSIHYLLDPHRTTELNLQGYRSLLDAVRTLSEDDQNRILQLAREMQRQRRRELRRQNRQMSIF